MCVCVGMCVYVRMCTCICVYMCTCDGAELRALCTQSINPATEPQPSIFIMNGFLAFFLEITFNF